MGRRKHTTRLSVDVDFGPPDTGDGVGHPQIAPGCSRIYRHLRDRGEDGPYEATPLSCRVSPIFTPLMSNQRLSDNSAINAGTKTTTTRMDS